MNLKDRLQSQKYTPESGTKLPDNKAVKPEPIIMFTSKKESK
jgi:hypothetical protein